jgi:hypothetical protein
MKKFLDFLAPFLERGLCIAALIFPFVEVSAYFGPKVFMTQDSQALKLFYTNNILKLSNFYAENTYLCFFVMIWVFVICSSGKLPFSSYIDIKMTKYLRYNVIQAILSNIVCSACGIIFSFLPLAIRESLIGLMLANSIYLGVILYMLYSSLLIFYGRYPQVPILSDAARLNVQRFYE